jgi:hypothetical protein
MTIPDDLREYLVARGNRKLTLKRCEVRWVEFFPPDELRARMFTIYKKNGFDHERFRGIDLVKSSSGYDPQGIMAWFSALKVYGQWDCDHHKIIVFPGATWSDIMANPVPYFGAQWDPDRVTHRYLRPRAKTSKGGKKQ